MAAQNVAGALGALDRLENALRLMRQNAGPEAISEALDNPKSKYREPRE